jgi:hypothetical protein
MAIAEIAVTTATMAAAAIAEIAVTTATMAIVAGVAAKSSAPIRPAQIGSVKRCDRMLV